LATAVNDLTYAPTTSWARVTYTGTVASNALEVCPVIAFTPTGTAGADDSLYITGVQLEIGTSATPFERRFYNTELANCQRYYETGFFIQYAYGGSGSGTGQWVNFSTTKRSTPTVALSSISYIYGINSGTSTTATVNGVQIFGNATSTGATAWYTTWTASIEL
jgi:hypothetical protein